jgi:hypothetical protein
MILGQILVIAMLVSMVIAMSISYQVAVFITKIRVLG